MALSEQDKEKIIKFVKTEPRSVQEVSKHIGRSWVTTDSYLSQVRDRTGLVDIKTFRKGSQGALKIAFYSQKDSPSSDDIKDELSEQIRRSRTKQEFDPFDIYQFVPDKKKKAFSIYTTDTTDTSKKKSKRTKGPCGPKFSTLLRQAENSIQLFSGNLSFLNLKESKVSLISVLEELLKRKVHIKILCRVDVSTMNNLSKLNTLLKKYPDFIELRHSIQPLRGIILDDKLARFSREASASQYKKGELSKNMKFFYEIYDEAWVSWLQKIFWSMFRTSLDYHSRMRQLEKAMS